MTEPNSFRMTTSMPANPHLPFKPEPSTSHAGFSPMGIYTASSSNLPNKFDHAPSSPFPNSPRSLSRLPQPYGNASTTLPPGRNMQTQLWMQNHYFDGNYPSPSPSVAPSVMSNLSCMSIPDDVSMLSVNTQMSGVSQFVDRRYLHTPNGQPSSASSVENVDPNEKNANNDQLDEMINALSDPEIQVRDKAISLIHMYLKMSGNKTFNRTKLKRLVNVFAHLINEFLNNNGQKNKQLRELVECLYTLVQPGRVEALRELIAEQKEGGPLSSILCKTFEQCDTPIDFLVIHIIRYFLSDTRYMACLNAIRRTAKKESFVFKLLDSIKNHVNNPSYIHYYVDVLRVLIKGSNSLKESVLNKDGMRLLLHIMAPNLTNLPSVPPRPSGPLPVLSEKFKHAVLKTIYSLISSDKRRFSEHFVECNGIEILACEFSKRSNQIIIRQILDIYCGVSDANGLKNRKLDEPLKMVLQELAKKADSTLTKTATGFICNLAGNNQQTKEFLTNNGAIAILLSLIRECLSALYCNPQQPTPEKKAEASEILENCLIALVNLSSNTNSAKASAFKTLTLHPLNQEFLFMVAGLSQAGGVENQRRLMTLLLRMCTFDMTLLDDMKCFDLLPKCLFQCIWTNARMCNEEKNQKELDIVKKAFNILTMLYSRNHSYAESILSIVKKDYNLFSLLNVISNVEICVSILSFIDQMCKDERMRLFYSGDAEALNIIERCSRSTAPGLEQVGVSLLKKLRLENDDYVPTLVGVLMESEDYSMM